MGWENAGTYLVLVGIAVVLATLLLRGRLRTGHRPGSFGESENRTKAGLERLVVEIREAAREELARMDTQMRLLQQLLAECDRKTKELRSLLEGPAAGATTAPPTSTASVRPSHPLHDQVYALRDAGRDIADISATTGLEKGEIELILGLRRPPSLKSPGGGPPTA